MKLKILFFLLILPASLIAGTDLNSGEVQDLMIRYRADMGSLRRFYFADNAPDGRERFRNVTKEYLVTLEALPFEKMNEGNRADFILFRRDLREQLRMLDVEEREMAALKPLFPFADRIYDLEKLRRRGTSPDAAQMAAGLQEAGRQIIAAGKSLSETSLDEPLITRAIQTTSGLKKALKSVHEFYNGYDPSYSWWMAVPYRKTDSLLTLLENLYRKKSDQLQTTVADGSGIKGKPVGRDELIRQLQYEMIPYTPEELLELANREFAWCDREMLKASREMGFGEDWRKAMEKVKNTYVPEGKQPEMILGLYKESIDFLKKNNLITIPPIAEETWRMIMMSPQRQLVNPFFTGGEVLSISYPTNTMEHEDKLMSMRGNNPHFSRATVHHELIAGHHLQGFMNNRYKTYRNFRTPFWTEGWALYWELLLWDMNFPKSPEDKIGMLFWRSHRCARIIFSLNYHLGKWTPSQCIDFLVDRVGHERANAEGEVRRSFAGGYGQLYQLAYMMGGLQFYALKKELVDTGKMTYRQYHDAVMQENAMPVEMLRAILTRKALPRNFTTEWKFYK